MRDGNVGLHCSGECINYKTQCDRTLVIMCRHHQETLEATICKAPRPALRLCVSDWRHTVLLGTCSTVRVTVVNYLNFKFKLFAFIIHSCLITTIIYNQRFRVFTPVKVYQLFTLVFLTS